MAKPKYIEELEKANAKLKEDQVALRKSQDEMMIAQGDILRNQTDFGDQLKVIHDALLGNEFTKEMNGGLIKKVSGVCTEVNELKRWREKVVIVNSLIYTALAGVISFLGAVIIKNWDKIFS